MYRLILLSIILYVNPTTAMHKHKAKTRFSNAANNRTLCTIEENTILSSFFLSNPKISINAQKSVPLTSAKITSSSLTRHLEIKVQQEGITSNQSFSNSSSTQLLEKIYNVPSNSLSAVDLKNNMEDIHTTPKLEAACEKSFIKALNIIDEKLTAYQDRLLKRHSGLIAQMLEIKIHIQEGMVDAQELNPKASPEQIIVESMHIITLALNSYYDHLQATLFPKGTLIAKKHTLEFNILRSDVKKLIEDIIETLSKTFNASHEILQKIVNEPRIRK